MNLLLAVRLPDLAVLEAESIAYHKWIIVNDPMEVGHRFTFGEQLLRPEEERGGKSRIRAGACARTTASTGPSGDSAIALQNLGEPKDAEDSFRLVLYWAKEKGETLAMFHTSLGVYYLSAEALAGSDLIIRCGGASECPDYYGNHWVIAKAQIELGNLSEAKQSLARALDTPGLRSPTKEEIEELLAEISQ